MISVDVAPAMALVVEHESSAAASDCGRSAVHASELSPSSTCTTLHRAIDTDYAAGCKQLAQQRYFESRGDLSSDDDASSVWSEQFDDSDDEVETVAFHASSVEPAPLFHELQHIYQLCAQMTKRGCSFSDESEADAFVLRSDDCTARTCLQSMLWRSTELRQIAWNHQFRVVPPAPPFEPGMQVFRRVSVNAALPMAETINGVKTISELPRPKVDVAVQVHMEHVQEPSIGKGYQLRCAVYGAGSGTLVLGIGGTLGGFSMGTIVGASVGLVPALFTFGLSIPIGATAGACAGICVGSTVGGATGMVTGGAAGYILAGSNVGK